MEEKEAVVLGAGPAGTTAAREIAEAGHDVLVFEKDHYAGETSVCGGGLTADFVEGIQLPDGIVEKKLNDWLIYMPDKAYHVGNIPALSFNRCVFDRFLAEHAAHRGADLRFESLVTEVRRNCQALTVHIKDRANTREYEVSTKLVIFADGPYTMAQRFGLGFPRGRPEITVNAAIYELEWKGNPLNCFEAFFDKQVAPWGYGWVYPKKDLLNVGVGSLMSKMKHDNIARYLNYFVEKHTPVSHRLRSLKRIRFAADIIPLPHVSRIVGDNMMVVGDAAGMVDPIWGGGIGPAMRGASIAGQIAAQALEDNKLDASFLSQYEKKWKKTSDYQHLRRAYLVHQLFLKYSKLDKGAYFKFIRLALWKGKVGELTLDPETLLSEGVVGVSNFGQQHAAAAAAGQGLDCSQ